MPKRKSLTGSFRQKNGDKITWDTHYGPGNWTEWNRLGNVIEPEKEDKYAEQISDLKNAIFRKIAKFQTFWPTNVKIARGPLLFPGVKKLHYENQKWNF